jgi:winged helix DNA-binding protein
VTAERVLSQRELNRALLARQLLLARQELPAGDAIAQVAGLQSQAPVPPFAGLWTRLEGFDEAELQALIDSREIVRATMMRHTIHFVTARDYLWLRPTIQPALDSSYGAQTGKRLAGFDIQPFLQAARRRFEDGPLTFAEVKDLIRGLDPGCDVDAVSYAVRTHLRLIGVPNGTRWRFGGRAPFVLAEDWLGRPLAGPDPREMVRRYLAAFGPATPGDATAWSGVGGMRALFEDLRSELRTFRDESGRELFDVPDGLLPDPGTPAPVRFLPEFDNTLLAHKDRTRVVADEHRARIYYLPSRIIGTVLLDGFVAAGWKLERKRGEATLAIEEFRPLTKKERRALEPEADALMRFVEPDAGTRAIRFVEAT